MFGGSCAVNFGTHGEPGMRQLQRHRRPPINGISSLLIGEVIQVSMPASPSHAAHTKSLSLDAIINIAVGAAAVLLVLWEVGLHTRTVSPQEQIYETVHESRSITAIKHGDCDPY